MAVSCVAPETSIITEEEAALYDRQLRLWGVESQARLKSARVLLLGVCPLACEIAKNLVLSGINTLTVVDNQICSEEDTKRNFLIPHDKVGCFRAEAILQRTRQLNPMVQIHALSQEVCVDTLDSLPQHDVVILVGNCARGSWSTFIKTLKNHFAAKHKETASEGPYFVLACVTGLYGAAFFDLGHHECIAEDVVVKRTVPQSSTKSSEPHTEEVLSKRVVQYPSLDGVLQMNWIKSDNSTRLVKQIPIGFFLFQVLQVAEAAGTASTVEDLKSHWSTVANLMEVPVSLLTDQDLSSCLGPSVAAVDAILGGLVAQEVVRAITRKGEPHGNCCFVDGFNCSATVDWLNPLKNKA